MINAGKLFWQRMFQWQGRTSRYDFWMGLLLGFICFVLVSTLLIFTFVALGDITGADEGTLDAVMLFFILIGSIIYFIAYITALARRLRDAGYEGWMAWITLIPIGRYSIWILAAFPTSDQFECEDDDEEHELRDLVAMPFEMFIEELDGEVNAADEEDYSVLQYVVGLSEDYDYDDSETLEMALYLLRNGADVNHQDDDGKTPLHVFFTMNEMASPEHKQNMLALLLAYGADVNIQDNTGRIPLAYAITHTGLPFAENEATYITLLEAGSNYNLKEANGQNIVQWATKLPEYHKVVPLMQKYGQYPINPDDLAFWQ